MDSQTAANFIDSDHTSNPVHDLVVLQSAAVASRQFRGASLRTCIVCTLSFIHSLNSTLGHQRKGWLSLNVPTVSVEQQEQLRVVVGPGNAR